jgi:hypothetical protein
MTLSSKRELIQAIRWVLERAITAQKTVHVEPATGLKRNRLNRYLLTGYKTGRCNKVPAWCQPV